MSEDTGAVLPPETTPEQLAALAAERPDLWGAIWNHPACYEGLRQWIGEQQSAQAAAHGQAPQAPQTTAQPVQPGQPEAPQTHPEAAQILPVKPKSRKGFAVIASAVAAALVLTGTGTALALTGTWPFGAGGVFSGYGGGATTVADSEDEISFANGAEVRWSVDGPALGLGRAHLGYMERMMPPVGTIDPGWADTIQIKDAVLVHASETGSRTVLALLNPETGEAIWSEETGSEYSAFSCEAGFDLARVFCVLQGESANEVVQLDASGEVGRFSIPAELNQLSIEAEGLVLSSGDRQEVVEYTEGGDQIGDTWQGSEYRVDGHYLVNDLDGWRLYDSEQRLVGEQRYEASNGVEPLCSAVLVSGRVLTHGSECEGSGGADGFAVEHLDGDGGYANYVPGEQPVWLIPVAGGISAFDVRSGEQLWIAEGVLPGWYQPAQIVASGSGEGGPSNGSVLVSRPGGYALVDLRSGESVSIASQADERAIAVSGDYVLGFLGDDSSSDYRGIEVFDARTGGPVGTYSISEIESVVEVRGGPEGVMLAHPFCTDCSTAEGASSLGGYTFVGPAEMLATGGGDAVAAADVPDFIPDCPGDTMLLAWMELEDGWVVVCGVDVDTPSYISYKSGEYQPERLSLGASKADGDLARSSVTWDAAQKRYVAAMADGSKLTLDYTIGTATLRDGETNSKVQEQHRFIRYVFVPLGGELRGEDASAGAAGAFDVRAPEATSEDQIRYMIEVLEKAYEGRALVKDALPKLAGCTAGAGGYADTVAAMKSVRDNRAELLQALDAMPVDKIPEGKQLLADLTEAIELSHQANVEYVTWAEAANASGCAQLSVAGKAAADASDAPKERFAARWNRVVAPAYGVRTFDAWYI